LNIIKDDPLDFSRNLKKELQERGKVDGIHLKTQIIPAKDGMQLNTEHYNIRLKQKSLKGFV
jgi:plasmid rolling circle replication initiator protein Rep